VTRELAEFAASLTYDDLPVGAVSALKRMILDSLGTALAATTLGDGCREVTTVMRGLGGPPQSTILGSSTKVAAPNAAFANGALVHALNYDPIGAEIGHVGVVCLVAPLAAAEARGGVSGRDFLSASAAACEVTARVTAAIARTGRRPSEKFLSGQMLNYFGAAVGAGRALGLDAEQMESALGLALMQMAGSRQIVEAGDPPAKAIYGAFPNQAGVLAALLSQSGLAARYDVIGDPCGLYPTIYGGDCLYDVLTARLGTDFLLQEVDFKPWPTSNQVHAFIEAALTIAEGGTAVADIASVEIVANSRLRPWCEPVATRLRPENAAAAGNSIPFSVAAALAHGGLGLRDVTGAGLTDPMTVAVAERVSCRLSDSVDGAIVIVTTGDNRRLQADVKTPLGHCSRPMSDSQIEAKFRDCCEHAAIPLSADQVERIIDGIRRIETLDDVTVLAALANGGG
jgi:2-methylcitrate dehydratase PrpD